MAADAAIRSDAGFVFLWAGQAGMRELFCSDGDREAGMRAEVHAHQSHESESDCSRITRLPLLLLMGGGK